MTQKETPVVVASAPKMMNQDARKPDSWLDNTYRSDDEGDGQVEVEESKEIEDVYEEDDEQV